MEARRYRARVKYNANSLSEAIAGPTPGDQIVAKCTRLRVIERR